MLTLHVCIMFLGSIVKKLHFSFKLLAVLFVCFGKTLIYTITYYTILQQYLLSNNTFTALEYRLIEVYLLQVLFTPKYVLDVV